LKLKKIFLNFTRVKWHFRFFRTHLKTDCHASSTRALKNPWYNRFEIGGAMDFETLHKKAIEIARVFHTAESDLIDILQHIDEKKVFVRLGFSSLFDYATRALKLSEAHASNFITVARKSKTIPELKHAIRSGVLTVSKARKITPVLTTDNSTHWIELAKTLSKPKLEKEVARLKPQTLTPERARYVTESRLELKLGVSEDLMKKLKRAQDLVSQKTRTSATFEDTLSELLNVYLQKQDPVEKAKRSLIKRSSADASASVPGTHETNSSVFIPGARYIHAAIKHAVNLRDQGQCAHVDENGNRCQARRWIEIHVRQAKLARFRSESSPAKPNQQQVPKLANMEVTM
jgi:hypothetical protein